MMKSVIIEGAVLWGINVRKAIMIVLNLGVYILNMIIQKTNYSAQVFKED
ncbi:hypothetical protein MACH09_13990 [Vibrio sp. MACH09]|nr:hypothetical protein MACH09_13990 [Vibrio sp. MACH09]